MRVLGFIGRIVLGAAVIVGIVLIFNPIGWLVCGPSKCMEGELYGQGHWIIFGVVGAIASVVAVFVVALTWALGMWTEDRAKDVKYEIDTWYTKKQLARIPPDALEDNGKPGNDYDIP